MTPHSPRTRGRFQSIRLRTLRILFSIHDREIEARDLRQSDLAHKLYSARERIRALLLELRRAERVFSASGASRETAEINLQELVLALDDIEKRLQRPETALRGAHDAVDVLTDMAGRFR